ncbi:hypothetical protein GGI25_004011 [Coemansia spiralis]|uniref:Zn(2)-C6 fungal-type domain-containing protein n=2 Tax=Coemansia TaxID=4863 RepID=A0A9W8G598_9FUNG|nr:hypothetical protein BX070DRAFT_38826 [Coemansia spiralis]KAJ1990104.1 hypothetical protein EDC05_004277 [Coemansia umbellata]KAJ2623808.1 hypothetical protein GGI26_002046 [Coemansia sp. RSA 1358]KAJ2675273.1 hypothetical protein GGI25_004011 [Coemansia spiralis]
MVKQNPLSKDNGSEGIEEPGLQDVPKQPRKRPAECLESSDDETGSPGSQNSQNDEDLPRTPSKRKEKKSSVFERAQQPRTTAAGRDGDCLRCRLTGTVCDRNSPKCTACANEYVACVLYPSTENDILFELLPQRATLAGSENRNTVRRTAGDWRRLKCSSEFLEERPDGSLRCPEDMADLTDNPMRNAVDQEMLKRMLAKPLLRAVADHPESQMADQTQHPLPSSELLRCISQSIARLEASKPPLDCPGGQEISISECMSGSSLLALGVLLQEYSRYLL